MAYGLTYSLDLERSSNQQAAAADSASLSITGNITIEGWVKLESTPASGAVWGLFTKDDLNTQRSYAVDLYNNAGSQKIRMFMSQNTAGTIFTEITFTYALPTATWVHVAIVTTIANATATRSELFIDGVSQGNGSGATAGGGASSISNGTASFVIGNYNAAFGNYYDGKVSLVRIWNTVRTSTEISNNMCNVFGTSTSGMAAEWSLDNVYTDASGNGNTLSPSGSPVFSVDTSSTCASSFTPTPLMEMMQISGGGV